MEKESTNQKWRTTTLARGEGDPHIEKKL